MRPLIIIIHPKMTDSGQKPFPNIFSHERGEAEARTRPLRRAHRNVLKGFLRENFFKSFP